MTHPTHSGTPPRRLPDPKRRSYKTLALVLRSDSIGDADRIATALTPAFGKLRLAVRGARRPASRIGGHLALLNLVQLDIATGTTFDIVTGAEAAETFPQLKNNINSLAEAYYIMELANLLLPEASPHPQAFPALLNALRALNSGRSPSAVSRFTELALLADAGYLPELQLCLVCRRNIQPNRHRFAPGLGGVVCDACPIPLGPALQLSVNTLKTLRYFASQPIEQALALKLPNDIHAQLENILGATVRHTLERDLHAAGFVERLRRDRQR